MEKRKMPKKEIINLLIDVLMGNKEVEDTQIFIDYLVNERELLEKKSARSGQTKNQKENEIIMNDIVEALTEIDKPVTITELQKENEQMAEFSNQKLTSLMKKLVERGLVVRIPDKKKTYFQINKEV